LHLFPLRKKQAVCRLASAGCSGRDTSAVFARNPPVPVIPPPGASDLTFVVAAWHATCKPRVLFMPLKPQ
jgi:hypothetical protein